MNIKKTLFLVTMVFFHATHASIIDKPAKCPSVEAVKAVGIGVQLKKTSHSTWAIINHKQRYDTKDVWDFAQLEVTARDEEGAKAQAYKELMSLTRVYGPRFWDLEEIWLCDYYGYMGQHAIAFARS